MYGFLEVDGPVTATSFQISGSGDYLATLNVVDAALSNDGKTLYIWKAGDDDESPSITFRKATTLTGAWGGGGHLLTISTDTDANINYKVAFDAPAQTANQYMEVEVGTVTAMGGGYISTPINVNTVVYGSGEDDDTVTTRYTKTWIEDISGLLENKTGATGESPKITANGTYGPGSGYVGIGSVVVDVPRRVSKGTWANGGLTVSASATGSNTAGISLDAADASWSGNVATVAIYDGDPGGSGVSTGFSVTVNATGRYNAGWNNGGATANLTRTTVHASDVPAGTTPATLEYDTIYKITPVYTNASGSTVAVTEHDVYLKTKVASGSITWPSSISRVSATSDTATFAGGGTTKNYQIVLGDFVSAAGTTCNAVKLMESNSVYAAIDIDGLLTTMWNAGAQSVRDAGGPYSAGPGTYTLNQYVTTLTVTGVSHDIQINDWWTADRVLSGWTRLNGLRNVYESARADSEFAVFEVTCGGTTKVYYMEP